MSALICDICGGDIIMNTTGEFAVCESCGMKHSKERVQAKIQEIKGTVAVEGTVEVMGTVKIDGINDAEKLYENAKAFIKLGEFEKCKKVLEELVDKYPDDYHGWWGMLELNTENFTKFYTSHYVFNKFVEHNFDFIKYFDHAISVVSDETIKDTLKKTYDNWYVKRYDYLSKQKLMYREPRYGNSCMIGGLLSNEHFYKEGVENAQKCNKKIGVFKSLGIDETYNIYTIKDHYSGEKRVYRFKKFLFVNGCTALIEYGNTSTICSVVNLTKIIRGNLDNYLDGLPEGNVQDEFKNDGCYVATCVYGSYDCPQVWVLRRFRDNTLAETILGKAFIRTYYAISPTLVKWFGNTCWFKKMWKGTLDKMVSKLQANGVEDTPYQDRIW